MVRRHLQLTKQIDIIAAILATRPMMMNHALTMPLATRPMMMSHAAIIIIIGVILAPALQPDVTATESGLPVATGPQHHA